MKNTIKFLTVLVAVFSFTFTACDEIEDLADVDFDSSLKGKYDLDFKAESADKIDESLTLDLAKNTSISKYLNQLKKVKITKITYQITQYVGKLNNVEMNVGFYMNGNTIVAPKEYNLSEKDVVHELTDTAILQTISTTLLSNKEVTLQLKGDYATASSATAEITVTVYFDATANPL